MPLISMEITTDTKNTITVLHRANPQLQNSIFKHITSISYAFLFIYADDGGGEASVILIKEPEWLPRTCLSFTSLTIAETYHTPPHCAHIHCLVSIKVHQLLMNINGCNFFPRGWMQWHRFSSSIVPYQTSFCQIAPLQGVFLKGGNKVWQQLLKS